MITTKVKHGTFRGGELWTEDGSWIEVDEKNQGSQKKKERQRQGPLRSFMRWGLRRSRRGHVVFAGYVDPAEETPPLYARIKREVF